MSLGEDRVVHHSKISCQLSALGQSLPKYDLGITSAYPPTAEIKGVEPN